MQLNKIVAMQEIRLVFYFLIGLGGVIAQNIVINYETSKMPEGLYHIEDNEILISSSQPPLLLTEPPILILSASSSSAAAAASKIKPTPATSMVLQTQKVTQQEHHNSVLASSVTQQISVKDSVNQLSQTRVVEDSVTNNDDKSKTISKDVKSSTTLTSSINDLFTSCTLTSN